MKLAILGNSDVMEKNGFRIRSQRPKIIWKQLVLFQDSFGCWPVIIEWPPWITSANQRRVLRLEKNKIKPFSYWIYHYKSPTLEPKYGVFRGLPRSTDWRFRKKNFFQSIGPKISLTYDDLYTFWGHFANHSVIWKPKLLINFFQVYASPFMIFNYLQTLIVPIFLLNSKN